MGARTRPGRITTLKVARSLGDGIVADLIAIGFLTERIPWLSLEDWFLLDVSLPI
jgi:hypothetical protein